MKTTRFFSSITLLIFTLSLHANSPINNKENDQNKTAQIQTEEIKNSSAQTVQFNNKIYFENLIEILKAYVLAYATYYGEEVFHEVGHAAIGKIVEPESVAQIHLNALPSNFKGNLHNPNDYANELFHIGQLYFRKGNPFKTDIRHIALFFSQKPTLFETKEKFLPFLIGGGVFQLIYIYSVFTYKAFSLKYKETQNFKESLLWGIKNAFFPYKNLLEKNNIERKELVYEAAFISMFLIFSLETLIPSLLPSISKQADGTLFWRTLIGREIPQSLEYIITYSIYPILLFFTYKAYKTISEGTQKITSQITENEIEDKQSEKAILATGIEAPEMVSNFYFP